MKQQFSSLIIGTMLCAAAFTAQAQQPQVRPCDTYNAMEQVFAADPSARVRYEHVQEVLFQEEQAMANAKTSSAYEYTVPVIFHVLHLGGAENISDATLINALDWVNKDYARAHNDASTVASPFEPLYVPSDIKLMLAHKDPNGNPTSGIEHIYDWRTNWDRNNFSTQTLYSGITWDPTKYLNIIIVKDIVAQPGQNGVVVGYTWLPGTWNAGNPADAVVYNYGYLTGINIRSLSHEVGHWFNLKHTFGDTNNPGVTCGDDGVSDTPPTKGAFSTCPNSLSGNTCSGSNGQTNVENIMDYSSCPKNFTQGQTTRMRNALASSVSNRQNVWQPSNLIATDVNGTSPCCPPIAEFFSANGSLTVCLGGSLQMSNYSYNGNVTSNTWAADMGASISSPTNSNTTITFATVGVTNVSLTVSNTLGSSTKVRQVVVLDNTPGMTGPYMESFENLGVPNGWTVTNLNSNSPTWEQSFPTYAYDGIASFFINESTSLPNQEDILETPIIDMQSSPLKQLSFAYAYAQKSSSSDATFRILGSTDCRGTWKELISLSAYQMQMGSGGVNANYYEPTSSTEWKVIDLSTYPSSQSAWNTVKNSPNLILQFRFKDITGGGNNFYLDAINLPGTATGINKLSLRYNANLYPNPSNGESVLSFNLQQQAPVDVAVYNVLGEKVSQLTNGTLDAGEHQVTVNAGAKLPPGVYFVNLSVNDGLITRKLIVK